MEGQLSLQTQPLIWQGWRYMAAPGVFHMFLHVSAAEVKSDMIALASLASCLADSICCCTI